MRNKIIILAILCCNIIIADQGSKYISKIYSIQRFEMGDFGYDEGLGKSLGERVFRHTILKNNNLENF